MNNGEAERVGQFGWHVYGISEMMGLEDGQQWRLPLLFVVERNREVSWVG